MASDMKIPGISKLAHCLAKDQVVIHTLKGFLEKDEDFISKEIYTNINSLCI